MKQEQNCCCDRLRTAAKKAEVLIASGMGKLYHDEGEGVRLLDAARSILRDAIACDAINCDVEEQ